MTPKLDEDEIQDILEVPFGDKAFWMDLEDSEDFDNEEDDYNYYEDYPNENDLDMNGDDQ